MAAINKQEFTELINTLVAIHNKGKYADIPNVVMDKSVQQLLKKYAEHYNLILTDTVDQLYNAVNSTDLLTVKKQSEIISKLEYRLNLLNKTVQENVEQDIIKAYITGQVTTAMNFIDKVDTTEVLQAVQFSIVNSNMASNLVADAMEDLLFVTQHTSKEVKKVVRTTFAEALQYQTINKEKSTATMQLLEKRLSKWGIKNKMYEDGFIGIVDKSGRKWKLKTYVEMAVNTKNHNAYVQGVKDKTLEYNTDLAKIPYRGSSDPCKHFEGMIISMNGLTKGFPTYDQLKSTGMVFHPRCRHSPMAIGDLDFIQDQDIEHHNKQVKKLNEKMEEYKAEQKAKAGLQAAAPVKKKRGRPKKKLNYEQISFFD